MALVIPFSRKTTSVPLESLEQTTPEAFSIVLGTLEVFLTAFFLALILRAFVLTLVIWAVAAFCGFSIVIRFTLARLRLHLLKVGEMVQGIFDVSGGFAKMPLPVRIGSQTDVLQCEQPFFQHLVGQDRRSLRDTAGEFIQQGDGLKGA